MSLYLLDSGPLGLITNPRASARTIACTEWFQNAIAAGDRVMIPEVADYELRRELIRTGKAPGLARLDALGEQIGIFPVDRPVWLKAAELWATARNTGQQTASDAALDADVILAACALVAADEGDAVIVVTGNVGHLGRFVDARNWETL